MAEENNVNEMRQIKRNKLDALIDQGNDPHVHEKYEDRTYSKEIIENYDQYEEKTVRLAGRIMSKRGHGKISFMDLQDATGRIQLFNKLNELGQEDFDQVQNLDIGDIVGVEGEIFTTNSGEISVRTKDLTLLTKSLQILPEKYHGLTDTDLRYRQRYVDLIMNPDVKETFITRSQIISKIREYLDNHGFLEVETPVLNTIAGGASARPFITHHNTLDLDMYLRIANELYLKRLIVGGFDKVYEMGRMFRNEGMDSTHNPEYTSIELYVAYEDYEYMMVLTEDLINFVVEEVTGSLVIDSNGTEIDFSKPWQRMTMVDSIKKYASVDFDQVHSDEEAIKLAEDHGIEVEDHFTKGHIIEEFFDKYVEDNLIQPTFITHHPKATSPLAKKDPDNPEYTHRFEAFCKGAEIGNAYSELNDARDQRERFQAQVEAGKKGDDEAQMMDHDFINALEVGLAPTGGLGIGVDRLVMLITGEESIRDVILFPTMKPIGHDIENKEDFEEEGDQDNKEPISEGKKIDLSKVKVEPLFQDMVSFDEFSQCDVRAVKVKDCQEVPKSRNLLKFILDDGSEEDRTILSGIKDYYKAEDLIGKTLLAIVNMPAKKMMGIDSEGMILSAVYDYGGEEALDLIMVPDHIPAGAKIY